MHFELNYYDMKESFDLQIIWIPIFAISLYQLEIEIQHEIIRHLLHS